MGGRNQVRRKNKIKRSLAFLSRLGYQPLFWKERRLANPRTSFLGVGSPFPRAARTACLERRLAICGFFGMFYVQVILQAVVVFSWDTALNQIPAEHVRTQERDPAHILLCAPSLAIQVCLSSYERLRVVCVHRVFVKSLHNLQNQNSPLNKTWFCFTA